MHKTRQKKVPKLEEEITIDNNLILTALSARSALTAPAQVPGPISVVH